MVKDTRDPPRRPQDPKQPTPEQIAQHDADVAERFALLPTTINAPTRENTAVCVPAGDGRCEMGFMRGLIESIPLWSGLFEMPYCSHVSLARNRLMHGFLQSPFEWAIMIDTDIVFAAKDFGYLLQGSSREGLENTYAVNAHYARKDEDGGTIEQGLGFARVHRSVFEVLAQTLCTSSEFRGERLTDFFVSGSLGLQNWMGEDAAFWLLCSEIGVRPRIEKRCRLQHIGRMPYVLESVER